MFQFLTIAAPNSAPLAPPREPLTPTARNICAHSVHHKSDGDTTVSPVFPVFLRGATPWHHEKSAKKTSMRNEAKLRQIRQNGVFLYLKEKITDASSERPTTDHSKARYAEAITSSADENFIDLAIRPNISGNNWTRWYSLYTTPAENAVVANPRDGADFVAVLGALATGRATSSPTGRKCAGIADR